MFLRSCPNRRRLRGFEHRRLRRGLAAFEVVIITGAIIPALIIMLWWGMKLMAALYSLVGTMMGSPVG